MTDQQQPAASYPGFEITSAGLEALYREFGRMAHQMFEVDSKATRVMAALQQVQTQLAPAETAEPTPIGAKAKAGGG